eukprot:jgi/Botrbrau1/5672/Bobra.0071s0014.1
MSFHGLYNVAQRGPQRVAYWELKSKMAWSALFDMGVLFVSIVSLALTNRPQKVWPFIPLMFNRLIELVCLNFDHVTNKAGIMQVVLCLTALVIYTTEVVTANVNRSISDYFSIILCSIIAAFEIALTWLATKWIHAYCIASMESRSRYIGREQDFRRPSNTETVAGLEAPHVPAGLATRIFVKVLHPGEEEDTVRSIAVLLCDHTALKNTYLPITTPAAATGHVPRSEESSIPSNVIETPDEAEGTLQISVQTGAGIGGNDWLEQGLTSGPAAPQSPVEALPMSGTHSSHLESLQTQLVGPDP